MSGLDGNPCVPEQSLSTSNRYEKASHREWADTSGRMKTPVKGATIKGNALGNQLRREDILPPFSRFYSLPSAPTVSQTPTARMRSTGRLLCGARVSVA